MSYLISRSRSVLFSNEAREIGFKLANILISHGDYAFLGMTFVDDTWKKRIRIEVQPQRVPSSILALYDPRRDSIYLKSETIFTREKGCAVFIHECTHALVDLQGQRTGNLEEEAAATIAEAWYLLSAIDRMGLKLSESLFNNEFELLTETVIKIASALRKRGKSSLAVVTPDELTDLKDEMRYVYGYRNKYNRNNGIHGMVG